MSASREELLNALKSSVEAMYSDLLCTGEMTKDELLQEIERLLDEII